MNILTYTKTIINIQKLDTELRDLFTIYSFLMVKGEEIKLHFSQNLTQAQIDSASALVNNFVEVSLLDETTNMLIKKQNDGHFLYQRIISQINIDGFANSPIDSGILVANQLSNIRNMLKDGFFEYALRYMVKTIIPLAIFTPDQITLFKLWIREAAKKYGTSDAVLDLIETLENI